MRGVIAHGDEGVIRRLTGEPQVAEDCEVAVMVGVKSRELFWENWDAGVHTVMLDKGYCRHRITGPVRQWEYWRMSVDAHHPTHSLMKIERPSDRWDALDLEIKPWRRRGKQILFAGSSAKYHEFYALPEPTEYAQRVFRKLRKYTERTIIYRPKPSWKDAVPISGTLYSKSPETLEMALAGAHCMITHGSNACFEAMLTGIPTLVLGDAVARPVSTTDITEVEDPKMIPDDERKQWLSNLAYCQFTAHEMESGLAWSIVRPQIYGAS